MNFHLIQHRALIKLQSQDLSPESDLLISAQYHRIPVQIFNQSLRLSPGSNLKSGILVLALPRTVQNKDVKSVPFWPEQPERAVPFIKPGQNGVVFVPVLIPVRSGNAGQILAGTPRFRSGRSVPALKSFFFFLNLWFFSSNFEIMFV